MSVESVDARRLLNTISGFMGEPLCQGVSRDRYVQDAVVALRGRIRTEEGDLDVGAPLRITADELAELLGRAIDELDAGDQRFVRGTRSASERSRSRGSPRTGATWRARARPGLGDARPVPGAQAPRMASTCWSRRLRESFGLQTGSAADHDRRST